MHLSASIQKSKSIGLGLGLQIACAVLAALATPAPAAAQLKVCNNTSTKVMVTISTTGMLDPTAFDAPTTTSGYTAIEAGVCQVVIVGARYSYTHIYLFAWQPGNSTYTWGGGDPDVYQHCVPIGSKGGAVLHFTYHDHEENNPPCTAGQVRLGYFLLPVEGRADFTETLNASSETAAPQPPNQPLAAPAPGKAPSAGPAASTAAPATTPKPAPAVLSTPTAPTGNAVLAVTSGLTAQPGGPNPLSGHTVVLLNQSFEAVLAGAGLQAPPGVSLVKGYLAACTNNQPACQAESPRRIPPRFPVRKQMRAARHNFPACRRALTTFSAWAPTTINCSSGIFRSN